LYEDVEAWARAVLAEPSLEEWQQANRQLRESGSSR
jgi:hypothetical protein